MVWKPLYWFGSERYASIHAFTWSAGTGVQPGCGLPKACDSAWVLIRNGWSGKSRRTTAVRYLFWLAGLVGS